MGSDVTLLSDIDGDGRAEVVVGVVEWGEERGPGSARLWFSGSLDAGGVFAAAGADLVANEVG